MLRDYPDVLTVKQVAEVLRISKNKAYSLVNNGIIGSLNVGRRILVPKVCVSDYLASARYKVSHL